jgi:mersacidin/lichenicidin family type 2 lantibiotic
MSMSKKVDVARAWKDAEYRASLTEEERNALPPNPAGDVELSDSELEAVAGGAADVSVGRTSCCTYYTAPPTPVEQA